MVDKFTVDYTTWYHGKGSETSALLEEDGMRCCVGFDMQACGYNDHELLGIKTVAELYSHGALRETGRFWMTGTSQGPYEAHALYCINDASDPKYLEFSAGEIVNEIIGKEFIENDADRMNAIAGIYKRHGVTVTFINVPNDVATWDGEKWI